MKAIAAKVVAMAVWWLVVVGLVLVGSIGWNGRTSMAAPTIEEYLSTFDTTPAAAVSRTTAVGTLAGWWVVAALGWDQGFVAEMPGSPEGTYTEGWDLLAAAESGGGDDPKWKIWAHRVEANGAVTVTFPAPDVEISEPDVHMHVLVVSGAPAGSRRAFRARPTTPLETSATSLELDQVYAANTTDRLVGFWMASLGATNITVPATMTALGEVDSGNATSRLGHQALTVHGPTGTRTATASNGRLWSGVLLEIQDGSGSITFPGSRLSFRVEAAIGADLTEDPDDWTWTDITSDVFWRGRISTTCGRRDQASVVEYGRCNFLLDNSTRRYSTQNTASPYYGLLRQNTPVRVWLNPGNGWSDRFSGHIPAFPPRWSTGSDRWIPVQARGPMYRAQTLADSMSSVKRATIRATGLVAYWPLESTGGAAAFSSALPGGTAMSANGSVSAGGESTMLGSDSLPTFSDASSIAGLIPNYTPGLVLSLQAFFRLTTDVSVTTTLLEFTMSATARTWRVIITPGTPDTMYLRAYDSNGIELALSFAVTGVTFNYNVWNHLYIEIIDFSGTLSWSLAITQGDGTGTGAANVITSGMGKVLSYRSDINAQLQGASLGHYAVFNDPDLGFSSPVWSFWKTINGHAGETAQERITRLCAEESLAVSFVESAIQADYDTSLGPQPSGTPMDVLRDTERTDGGILYERGFGLEYLTRGARYNPPLSLELDYANRPLWNEPQPTDDDQRLVNDSTVTNGWTQVSARATDQDSIDTIGRKPSSVGVNYENDLPLPDRASMEVAIGTNGGSGELRWPELSLNFARAAATGHIDSWLALPRAGGALVITNPPDDAASEDVGLVVEGWSEVLTQRTWEIEPIGCSPSSIWAMWTIEGDDNTGRLEGDGVELAGPVTAIETVLPVTVPADRPLVTTNSGDRPFDLEIRSSGYTAGERITVTDVDDVTAAFVAVGAVATGNNASVTPGLPAGRAVGDGLYILASIRNSGAGVPNTPAGFQLMPVFQSDSNVQLFGRIATATAADQPLVSFSGGVAGADTLAQMIAVRGGTLGIHASEWAGPGIAAQDIAFVGIEITEDDCFVLALGWKQDDWTSVATLAGFTEIAEPDATAGNDAGMVWDYVLQTTATDIADGSFVVTGGAAAISRAAVVAIRTSRQLLTVTRSVNGASLAHTDGATLKLWRPSRLAM